MGGQNLNAPGRNPSGNPTNADTSVTSRSPGNPIPPVQAPVNINGGQGKVGGKYGVQITTDKPNAYGESQDRGGGGRGIVGGPHGVILKDSQSQDYTAKANEYTKSLVINRGLAPNSTEYNTALQNYLRANRLEESRSEDITPPSSISPSFKPEENYGYSVNVSPIISENFAKNPLETNFELSKDKLASQARERSRESFQSIQGGVETTQSKGQSFGYAWASGQRDIIGTKIFSGQTQFSRGSTAEEAVKNSEAARALGSIKSTSNQDYITGGTKEPAYNSVITTGKANQVFGKTASGVFGWSDISKNQLSRGSTAEENAKNIAIAKASKVYPTFTNGNPLRDTTVGGPIKSTGGKNNQVLLTENLGINENISGNTRINQSQNSQMSFEDFFSAAQAKGSKIDIFNAQGAKVGTVNADNKGLQTLISLGDTQGVYFKEQRLPSNQPLDRSFADYVSKYGNQGATVELFQGNKKIGQVSGPNAYRESIPLLTKYGGTIYAQVIFSTTREGKQLSESVISKARNIGSENIDIFETPAIGPPTKITSIPINQAQTLLPSILDKYSTQNISFSFNPKTQTSPKDTTLIPASVLPLELNYQSSKAFTGQYFDVFKEAGKFLEQKTTEAKLPFIPKNETINQFGITFPNPSVGFREIGSDLFSLAIVGPIKTIPPLIAGLGESYYSLFTTGTTGGPAVKISSPKALVNIIGQSLFEPRTFMSEKASKNFDDVSKFIHEKIGGLIREQGISIPQPVENAKTSGAFIGTALGIGTMIPTELNPFGIGRIPLKVAPVDLLGTGLGEKSMATSLMLGSRELITKTAGGFKLGRTKPQDILPEGYQIAAKATRGEQYGTANKYALSKLSSDEFLKYAEQTGRAVPDTAELNARFKNLKESADISGEYKKQLTEIPTSTEKITPQVGKAVLESNAKLNARINYLRILSTGRGGVQQGSTITKLYTNPEIATAVFGQFPAQDIDIRVGNPVAGEGGRGILGIDFSSRQAIAQATSAQNAIEVVQGIRRKEGIGFHATATRKEALNIIKSPSTEESQRGGFFVMNRVDKIVPGYGNFVLKIGFNPKAVLKFKSLSKEEQGKIRSRDWLAFQNNLIKAGLQKGFDIVEKPYVNTKKGASANPEAKTFETIFINPKSLQSITSIELLPKMQLTGTEKAHIIDLKTGEKLVEFTTEKDTENEIASTLKPQGTILGQDINYKVYKTKIQGSKLKGPHFGGQYQEETGLSQILSFQTKQTLSQQQASKELIESIGTKFFIGPKAFGQGKEIVRTLGLFATKAAEFKANPITKARGIQMEKDIARIKEIYGPLYNIDFDKPVTGNDFTPSASYFGKSVSSKNQISNYARITSGIISGPSGRQRSSDVSKLSKISRSSIISTTSSFSKQSIISGVSNISNISKISKISNLSSIISGPSGRSGPSGPSGRSGPSGPSGRSGPSGPSGRSGPSGPSGRSGPSGPSGRSGPSGPSGRSGPSGPSGRSGFGGSSYISNIPNISRLIIPTVHGFPKRPRYRPKEGPTRTYLYGVSNIFASSLSLKRGK